jgi:PAS domain S-box-containing protein
VIIIALSAAATAGYAPIRASHLSHVLLSQVPFVIRFFVEGTTVHVSLALLDIMFILTLYRIGHNLRRASTEALTTSFRNEELAATLVEEKAKIEALNIQLRESEERFRALSEATFEGIAIHEDGIAVDFNQAATQMFGYTEEEAIGMHVFDLLQPETRAIAIQNMRTNYEKPYEVQGIRKDGTIFPLEIQGKTVPYKGKQARVVAIRDITRRKETEARP